MEEADESVAVGDLAEDFHDQHVVVAAEIEFLEHRGELELRRRDLVVARLGRDAELPKLLLDLAHEVQDAVADRAEVVVLKLLMLRGRRTEKRPTRHHEIGTREVVRLVDQEVLLFRPEGDRDLLFRLAETLHEALRGRAQILHRTQERRLLVKRLARVRAERGRNTQGRAVAVALDERRGGRIPRRVAARFESGTNAARREARRVRLADDQVLARKRLHGLAVDDLQKRVVLLCGRPGQRQEPVGVVRRAAVHRPVAHRVGDFAGDGRVERLTAVYCRQKLLAGLLREVLLHRLLREDIFRVTDVTHIVVNLYRSRRRCRLQIRHLLHCRQTGTYAHCIDPFTLSGRHTGNPRR